MDKNTQYFLDTEFIEYPNTIELISIGLVSIDGREYHAISSEYNSRKANKWVVENVLTPLYEQTVGHSLFYTPFNFHQDYGKPLEDIRLEVLDFVGYPNYPNGKPEFWGYFADYDWVVFCWIFGRMVDLPDGFPMFCCDLKQWMKQLNVTKESLGLSDAKGEHNALEDAKWNRELYIRLKAVENM